MYVVFIIERDRCRIPKCHHRETTTTHVCHVCRSYYKHIYAFLLCVYTYIYKCICVHVRLKRQQQRIRRCGGGAGSRLYRDCSNSRRCNNPYVYPREPRCVCQDGRPARISAVARRPLASVVHQQRSGRNRNHRGRHERSPTTIGSGLRTTTTETISDRT